MALSFQEFSVRLRVLLSAFVMVACSLAARADSFTFSFGATADTFAGSGVLTATQLSATQYLITAVTGTTRTTVNGDDKNIAGIQAAGGFEGNDNLLNLINGVYSFSSNGLSYTLANGAQLNLFFSDGEFLERVGGKIISENAAITILPAATAATPEPSSLALLGTGVLGVIGAARRRLA